MSRIAPLTVVAVVIGAGVGTGLLATWATVGAPTQCVASRAAQNLTTLTPYLIVNSPYLGHANGTWTRYENTSTTTVKVAGTIGSANGSVDYLFQGTTWTVWTTERIGNPSGSCAGVFAVTSTEYGFSLTYASATNFTNDSQAQQESGDGSPPYTTGGPFDPLYFNDSFYRTGRTVDTCGGFAQTMSVGSDHIDLELPFVYQGVHRIAHITLAEFTNFTYSFPANGGVWAVDALSGPGGPGGGWAFSYLRGCA